MIAGHALHSLGLEPWFKDRHIADRKAGGQVGCVHSGTSACQLYTAQGGVSCLSSGICRPTVSDCEQPGGGDHSC